MTRFFLNVVGIFEGGVRKFRKRLVALGDYFSGFIEENTPENSLRLHWQVFYGFKFDFPIMFFFSFLILVS